MPIQILPSLHFSPSQEKDLIVGIDLGTTHSLVAVVRDGVPEVLKSREGQALLPSIVSFTPDGHQIGYGAKLAKRRGDPQTIFSSKRLMGKSLAELGGAVAQLPYPVKESQGMISIEVGNRSYTAIEVSALILRELKAAAEKSLGSAVSKAVITVPAYFNDNQRQATRLAGRLAGWDVLRIINEPTAAALAYGWGRDKEGIIAVFDLGGGTFDVSILKLQGGIFEVLSTHGDTALGGDDFDLALVESLRSPMEVALTESLESVELRALALEAAEQAKIKLSENADTVFKVEWNGKSFTRSIDRKAYAQIVEPLLERTRQSCQQALKDAGVSAEQLADVILVGGPTRLPLVRDFAARLFGRSPNVSVHPEQVVALGAAVQADILAGNTQDLLLLDVVPLSLGIETYGGLMSPLIRRNSRIPTVAKDIYTTFADFQTGVEIHVLQGEREKVADNRSLARFTLAGIKPQVAGTPRIEVSFMIDADGILQVAAKDLVTQQVQAIEVRPTSGLTDQAVEKMLLDGLEHAGEDAQYRDLIDARNKAEPSLKAAQQRISDAQRLLPPEEAQRIEQSIRGLRVAMEASDAQAIKKANAELNHATLRLAELLVKEVIESAPKR